MSESAPPPKILPEHFGELKSLEITVRRGILSAEDFALKTANRRSFRDAVEMIKERDAAIEARVRAEFVHIGWQYQDDEGHWRSDSFYNGHRAGVSRKLYAAANPGDAK